MATDGDMERFRTYLIEKFGSLDKAYQRLDFFKHGRVSCVEFQEVLHGQESYCSLHEARNLFFALSEDGLLQRKNLLNLEAQMALRVALGWHQESANTPKGGRPRLSPGHRADDKVDRLSQVSPSTRNRATPSFSSGHFVEDEGYTLIQESPTTPKDAARNLSPGHRVEDEGDRLIQESPTTPKGAARNLSPGHRADDEGDCLSDSLFYLSGSENGRWSYWSSPWRSKHYGTRKTFHS
eukprot:GEMP01076697.1.p1 GENE.GEMP01076697.1~~GEMP01076697.1.p1  ORF type:complete len:238 (+),score=54.74 GEMP01076697.1:177-890(+)